MDKIIYNKITISVPEGYEQQVMDFALMKIEAIISQLTLAPTQVQKDEYQTKVEESRTINKIIKK